MRTFKFAVIAIGFCIASATTIAAPSARDTAAPTCVYTAGSASIAVGGQPFAVEPSADGCWIFASLAGDEGRSGIALLHNVGGRFVLSRTVDVKDGIADLVLTRDGKLLMGADDAGVRVFDVDRLEKGEDHADLGEVPDGTETAPVMIALSADEHLMFVSDEDGNQITVSNLAAGRRDGFGPNTVIGRIPQGAGPVGLAMSPDGSLLYAVSERSDPGLHFANRCRSETPGSTKLHAEGALSVIDVAKAATDLSKSVIAVLPAGCDPVRVVVSSDGTTVFVTARGENAVYATHFAHPATPSIYTRTRFDVGQSPVGLVIAAKSGRVWVSNSSRFSNAEGEIQTVGTPEMPDITRVKTGQFPRNLRFLPDGVTLAVAVFGAQAVQFVKTD